MSNCYYSNARARSLELNLLGKDRINRLIECDNGENALKILAEVNFGEGCIISSFLDFENLISAEKKSLFEFIKECSPKREVLQFLLIKNDFHNANAIIRNKYLKIDIDSFVVEEGIYSLETIKDKIIVDDYSLFEAELATALKNADQMFVSGNYDGEKLDLIFDKEYYNFLLRISRKNSFLKKIVVNKIDCINMSVAFRYRNFDESKDKFLGGGKLSLSELKDICIESLDLLKEKFSYSCYNGYISNAVESLKNNMPLSGFEKMTDDFIVTELLKEKYAITGYIPFIQYCYYKLADLFNVRMILVGLINGIDKNEIRKRIRVYYEG